MDKLQTQEQVQSQVQTQVDSQLQPQPNLTDEIVYFEGNVPDYCMISNKKWIFGKSIIPINQVAFIDFVRKTGAKEAEEQRDAIIRIAGVLGGIGGLCLWLINIYVGIVICVIAFICFLSLALVEEKVCYVIKVGTGYKTFDIIVDYDEAKIVYDIMSKALNERTF